MSNPVLGASSTAAAPAQPGPVTVDADGTTHIPDVAIPFSSLASPAALPRRPHLNLIAHPYPTSANASTNSGAGWTRNFFGPQLCAIQGALSRSISNPRMIADVRTDIITAQGSASRWRNKGRILINVHVRRGFVIGGGGNQRPGSTRSPLPASAGSKSSASITACFRNINPRRRARMWLPSHTEPLKAVQSGVHRHLRMPSAGGILTAQSVAFGLSKDTICRVPARSASSAPRSAVSARAILDSCGRSIRCRASRGQRLERGSGIRERLLAWRAPTPKIRWSR